MLDASKRRDHQQQISADEGEERHAKKLHHHIVVSSAAPLNPMARVPRRINTATASSKDVGLHEEIVRCRRSRSTAG